MAITAVAGDDDPLRGLQAVAELRRDAARREAAGVRAARMAGLSWNMIAAALDRPTRDVRREHDPRRLGARRPWRRRRMA